MTGLRWVDGMQSGHYAREQFEANAAGGLLCATVTVGVWEDFPEAVDATLAWRRAIEANADVAMHARTMADIRSAEDQDRVALLLGFQNSNLVADRLDRVEAFHDLGVRVMQLTYNNANHAASGCYEAADGGLTRFGRGFVAELNRLGMLVDLSHVGNRSAADTIASSSHPVAFTHANAADLFDHPRNKPTWLLKELASRGGVIGCALYPNLVGPEFSATLDTWCEMVARTAEIVGVEHVAIGSDLGGTYSSTQMDRLRSGYWTRAVDPGAATPGTPDLAEPVWLPEMGQATQIEEGLARAGFSADDIVRVLRENWLALYAEVLG
ncbi:membrane dipeptidase [Nocardioides sp. BP30]|uniref:membrane dipeptidase n=1 Tax=Nocardioides sp. BP30 TaxID=3036374 RepID=UPI002469436A|nr:membrane dipeptidase [Nocardioides sp. BP30]WGL52804.1 membrane dipeptidase [Nocardioides sp. BP30]